ncbi:hypothetical protein ANCDUO_03586 [Ancylostoma duodenale]|uniref:Uncharacterized protein n=1 Tax=Ancylostoma duodenale TaxID=51022 RepID=A0A0C2D8N2_9BILA|nr:hypothetical protein ANCDUO_03586 [Ancylostoma duodenale]
MEKFALIGRVYFNNFAYTTPPLAISLVDTMIMSEALKKPVTLMVFNNELARKACQLLDCFHPLYKNNIQCCGRPEGD